MARFQKLDERLTEDAARQLLHNYFDTTKAAGEYLTYSGMAIALGCSLQVLRNYLADHKDSHLFTVIEEAFAIVDQQNEQTMINPENRNIAGALFALKNRGWKDTQSIESSVTVHDARGLFDLAQTSDLFSHTKESAAISTEGNDGERAKTSATH